MTADKMPDYIFAWRDETPNKRPRWSPIIPGPKAELWEKYIRADLPDPRLEILAAALRLIEQHHAWHQEIGTVYFADADGKDYIPVDLSDGYCDSKL